MVLLDRIAAAEGDTVTTEVTLRQDSPFVQRGQARAVVSLEYMAQTIGVFAGLTSCNQNERPEVGFVIAVTDFNLHVNAFFVGDCLTVSATRMWGDERLGKFRCQARRCHGLMAEATISVYRGQLPEENHR